MRCECECYVLSEMFDGGGTGPRRAALYSGGTRRAREAPVDSHSTTRDASHVGNASAGDRSDSQP